MISGAPGRKGNRNRTTDSERNHTAWLQFTLWSVSDLCQRHDGYNGFEVREVEPVSADIPIQACPIKHRHACELIDRKVGKDERVLREIGEHRRHIAAKKIIADTEVCELMEVCQFRRKSAGELVVAEIKY